MGAACSGLVLYVGVKEQVLGPFDAGPVWCCVGLGEEDVFGWFGGAGMSAMSWVVDAGELEVGDEL